MAESIDLDPTAEASYARTLMARGCPKALADCAAKILAQEENPDQRSQDDDEIVTLAYAQIR